MVEGQEVKKVYKCTTITTCDGKGYFIVNILRVQSHKKTFHYVFVIASVILHWFSYLMKNSPQVKEKAWNVINYVHLNSLTSPMMLRIHGYIEFLTNQQVMLIVKYTTLASVFRKVSITLLQFDIYQGIDFFKSGTLLSQHPFLISAAP